MEFLTNQRRTAIRNQDASLGLGTMSVTARMKFEKFALRAEDSMLKARREQSAFWEELSAIKPSLVKLDLIGKSFEEARNDANQSFAELLKLNPSSVTTMRKYAVFLDEVANDPVKALKMVTQASDIDDALSKEHADISSSVVMFAKVRSWVRASETFNILYRDVLCCLGVDTGRLSRRCTALTLSTRFIIGSSWVSVCRLPL